MEEASPVPRVYSPEHQGLVSTSHKVGPASGWPPEPADPLGLVIVQIVCEGLDEVKGYLGIARRPAKDSVGRRNHPVTAQEGEPRGPTLSVENRPAGAQRPVKHVQIVLSGHGLSRGIAPSGLVCLKVHVGVQADEDPTQRVRHYWIVHPEAGKRETAPEAAEVLNHYPVSVPQAPGLVDPLLVPVV